uniref:Dynein light chain Tctex-type 3 n=1 Tax=Chelydra serpentina TaxID=8475 RepID=A0A8C3TBV5_CHESE
MHVQYKPPPASEVLEKRHSKSGENQIQCENFGFKRQSFLVININKISIPRYYFNWTATIVEQSLTHLVKLGKTYKYIVTCAVMQKSGAGLHTASSCFWDTTTDGTCTVRWENRTMNCIVNVFAIAVVL